LTSTNTGTYLPYVDIYINYQAKQNSNLAAINHSLYPYNVLDTPLSLENTLEYDNLGNLILDTLDADNDGNTTESKLTPLP
jgi:hypothetical protein